MKNPRSQIHALPSRRPSRTHTAIALLALALCLAAGTASSLSFQVDFVNSTYDTQAGDTFSDLLAEHQSSSLIQSTVTTGLENISTSVYAGGVNRDYSILLTTTLDVAVAGSYTFQVGTDWGRGGAAALIDDTTNTILSERVIDDDVWWGNSWSNPDVFTTTANFSVGDSLTLMWVGFEGCCGGSTTLRFSVDGGAFVAVNETNLAGYVLTPEPTIALLLGLGLAYLGAQGMGLRERA